MTKAICLWDKVMFYALLVLVIFIPYSAAIIQGCLFILIIAWIVRRILIWSSHPKSNFLLAFYFPINGLGLPLILIALLIVGTTPFSCAPFLSLKKFFSRFLQQIFLMSVIIEIIQTPRRLYQLLIFLMWTLLVVMVDVFVQFKIGHSFIFHKHTIIYERVSGSMRHPNDLGTLLVTVLPITLALIFSRRFWLPIVFQKLWLKPFSVLCGIIFLSMLIALGLTSSRGAWVAFVISMIGGSVYLKKSWWTGLIVLMLIVFLSIFGFYFANTRTDIFNKNAVHNEQTVQDQGSTQNAGKKFFNPSRRFEYWQTAFKVIEQFPLFGCGYNAYIQTLQKINLNPVEYPHNSILHIATELGLIGLILYIWFWLALFLEGIKLLKTIEFHQDLHLLGVGIFFGIGAWFIHSLFDTPWESLQLSILWWFLIGVLMSLKNVSENLSLSMRDI